MTIPSKDKQQRPYKVDKVDRTSPATIAFTAGGPTRSPESDEQEEVRGVAKAIRTIDEEKRRPGHKNILLEIDKLVRSAKKEGNA